MRQPANTTLKRTLLAPIAIASLVVMVLVLLIARSYLDKLRLDDAHHRAEIIAYAVQYAAILADENTELSRTVQALSAEHEVAGIHVVSLDSGLVFASTRFAWLGQPAEQTGLSAHNQAAIAEFIQGRKQDIASLQPDGRIYSYLSPFVRERAGGEAAQERGLVLVNMDTGPMFIDINRQLQLMGLVAAIAGLVIVLLLYLLLSRYVFKPLQDLESATDRRSSGDKTAQAPVHRNDEIGALAQTLNILFETEASILRKLERRERDLQMIFDTVPLRIWYKDDKNTMLRLNTAAAQSMGRTVSELEGRDTAEFFPEMAEAYLRDDLEVIESGEPKLNIIERFTPKDQDHGWVKTDKVPYFSDDGSTRGVLVVSQDITALKATEDQLRESEERFKLVSMATGDGIWDWPDITRDYQYWSPRWKQILGYENNELEPSTDLFLELLHPDDRKFIEEFAGLNLKSGESFEHESRMRCKDGTYKWVLGKVMVLHDEETGVTRMCGAIRDIQDRKNAEMALAQYMEDLERSNQDLDEFAYLASHDLKAPLRGIDQLATWIGEDVAEGNNEEVQKNIRLMRNRVHRLERLLTDLLQYSQVGRRDEQIQKVDTAVLIRELFELSTPPEKFQLHIDGPLPVFETLAVPFEQVLRNLISNAIKHREKDEGALTISCPNIDSDDRYYEFVVSDDGPGIDPKYHELVYKMFKSLKPRDEVEGSGMGLAMVKKILHTYGGGIELQSEVGQGTSFHVRWPRTPRQ